MTFTDVVTEFVNKRTYLIQVGYDMYLSVFVNLISDKRFCILL